MVCILYWFQERTIHYDVPANETDPPNMDGSNCALFDRDRTQLEERLQIHFFYDQWLLELDFLYNYDPSNGDREWYLADIDLFYEYSKFYFPELSDDANYTRE